MKEVRDRRRRTGSGGMSERAGGGREGLKGGHYCFRKTRSMRNSIRET